MKEFENESQKVRLERIIRSEIVPQLQLLAGPLSEELIDLLIKSSKMLKVVKDQYIDERGSSEDGKLVYLHAGIAHTFYYNETSDKPMITRIWKKREVMFDMNSFINSEDRTETIQMLEDGELLSLSYSNLKGLLDSFPKMISFLLYLQAEREKQYKFYQHLLKLTVDERVKMYLDYNPAVINRVNNDYIALHLGICRSRFSKAYAAYKLEINISG